MKKRIIVTGAGGHLGSTIVRMLENTPCEVYGLILPSEELQDHGNIHYIKGDVRDIPSLRPLFEHRSPRQLSVIHTAGIISIAKKASQAIYDVNIGGTENILSLCREYKTRRLVYVSSVHAIAEPPRDQVISETDRFSPECVKGVYAQTKAAATRAVLEAGRQGLDVVVVHPSGIIGPRDPSGNHLVQMITDYLRGALPACVRGGYDFVDVRDVAQGCLQALARGKSGSCYILSNRHYEIKQVLEMAGQASGVPKPAVLPMWVASMAAPLLEKWAKLRKRRPLYTRYSLYTLRSNDRFSHDKATAELGYRPRDLKETIRDTVSWYQSLRTASAPA